MHTTKTAFQGRERVIDFRHTIVQNSMAFGINIELSYTRMLSKKQIIADPAVSDAMLLLIAAMVDGDGIVAEVEFLQQLAMFFHYPLLSIEKLRRMFIAFAGRSIRLPELLQRQIELGHIRFVESDDDLTMDSYCLLTDRGKARLLVMLNDAALAMDIIAYRPVIRFFLYEQVSGIEHKPSTQGRRIFFSDVPPEERNTRILRNLLHICADPRVGKVKWGGFMNAAGLELGGIKRENLLDMFLLRKRSIISEQDVEAWFCIMKDKTIEE